LLQRTAVFWRYAAPKVGGKPMRRDEFVALPWNRLRSEGVLMSETSGGAPKEHACVSIRSSSLGEVCQPSADCGRATGPVPPRGKIYVDGRRLYCRSAARRRPSSLARGRRRGGGGRGWGGRGGSRRRNRRTRRRIWQTRRLCCPPRRCSLLPRRAYRWGASCQWGTNRSRRDGSSFGWQQPCRRTFLDVACRRRKRAASQRG